MASSALPGQRRGGSSSSAVSALLVIVMAVAIRWWFREVGGACKVLLHAASAWVIVGPSIAIVALSVVIVGLGLGIHRMRAGWASLALGACLSLSVAVLLFVNNIRPWAGATFHGLATLQPNGTWREARPELKGVVYHDNAFGFRVPQFSETKTPGVVRVAVVGDSFVYGIGVEDDETLSANIALRARAAGLDGEIEVLNLGLPGANLPTHIRLYDIARRDLGADVVVMTLFLWNNLSLWDSQEEARDSARPSAFSLLQWLLGNQAATALTTRLLVEHDMPSISLAALDRLKPRLQSVREPLADSPPLVAVVYNAPAPAMESVRTIPDLHIVVAPENPENFIPVDGHPSALGNRVVSELVWKELSTLPVIQRLAPANTAGAGSP